MIFDSLANFSTYNGAHHLFPIVHDYLQGRDLAALPLGRHDIAGGIHAIVNKYKTLHPEETFIECHRKFIDIQIMLHGAEKIGVCLTDNCEQLAYNERQDFQTLKGEVDIITLRQGYFAIFFPQDGHMPQLQLDGPEDVKKLVIKVPV